MHRNHLTIWLFAAFPERQLWVPLWRSTYISYHPRVKTIQDIGLILPREAQSGGIGDLPQGS